MSIAPEIVTRFAPSPNGRLHLGHAFSALMGQYLAGEGRFLLRIEDIDLGRRRDNFMTAIYDDLAWLGLSWEQPVMLQSSRFDIYRAALDRLIKMQVVYPCWATRKEILDVIQAKGSRADWPADPDGAPIYPGIYRDISPARRNELMWENTSYAWRLDTSRALAAIEKKGIKTITYHEKSTGETVLVTPQVFGDVVIARKDVPTSYHLSVVVDDAAQNVNLVTRGMDLQAATHVHRILQILLDLPEPDYYHHPLVRNPQGRRLSKRAGDSGFDLHRQQGMTAQQVIDMLPPPIGILSPPIGGSDQS